MYKFVCSILPIIILFTVDSVYARQTIFWLSSYHPSNQWTAEMQDAIRKKVEYEDVKLITHHMDTKRNNSESYKKKAAQIAAEKIRRIGPDIVIASEDDASKYVVQPYFKNADIPFIFCGINHSADRYGYPYKNATGMIEVDPIEKLIYSLQTIFSLNHIHPIRTVGYIAEDSSSTHINSSYYKNKIHFDFVEYYVRTIAEWQECYRKAQNEVDLLIIGNISSIKDWNNSAAMDTISTVSKIPTGTVLDFLAPYAFISCIKLASEQGGWAATRALDVINGIKISDIPIAEPMREKLIINKTLATILKVIVPWSYLKKADKVISPTTKFHTTLPL